MSAGSSFYECSLVVLIFAQSYNLFHDSSFLVILTYISNYSIYLNYYYILQVLKLIYSYSIPFYFTRVLLNCFIFNDFIVSIFFHLLCIYIHIFFSPVALLRELKFNFLGDDDRCGQTNSKAGESFSIL